MDPSCYARLHDVQQRHWWYAARRSILWAVVNDLYRQGLPPGVLYDLGCGVGANLSVLDQFGVAIGIDTSPEAVAFAHERGHSNVRQADLNDLAGLETGTASIVLLADVIEHLNDEGPCLAAAWRLLKPGGALIVTVPAFMFLWGPADEFYQHRRRYTDKQLRQVVSRHFDVERTTYFNSFLFGVVCAGRLVERVMRRGGDDTAHVPTAPLNAALRAVFAAEVPLVKRGLLPFGVSILCVARKPPRPE